MLFFQGFRCPASKDMLCVSPPTMLVLHCSKTVVHSKEERNRGWLCGLLDQECYSQVLRVAPGNERVIQLNLG
jgi:hypothetical protein